MSKSTLIGIALAFTALTSGCGKDDPQAQSVQKPALTAAQPKVGTNGSTDQYAGTTGVNRPDDARPAPSSVGFTDAESAKQFVDERDHLDPKDAALRDQLIGLLSFWDNSSDKAQKTSVHVRKQAESILKRGAPFAAMEQAALMAVVDSKDPDAGIRAVKVVLEQKTDLTPDTRAKLIAALGFWNGTSKTYAKKSKDLREEAQKGLKRLLPLTEAEQGLVMDQVEQKDPFTAVIGLELLKKQKKDLSSAMRERIRALAAYDKQDNNDYAKESNKVRKLVASILK
jgi:hypothetical protein